jgi:hypothetical protein
MDAEEKSVIESRLALARAELDEAKRVAGHAARIAAELCNEVMRG